jgi:hypothetical protein
VERPLFEVKKDELEDYRLANPVLYLYRHWLELALKGLIGTGVHEHDLGQLAAMFESSVKQSTGGPVPRWIVGRLKEVAAIDPNSTAFRYAEVRDKKTKRTEPVDGEILSQPASPPRGDGSIECCLRLSGGWRRGPSRPDRRGLGR